MAGSRELAAILAADVVGYSRLAGTDEDCTLARLGACTSMAQRTATTTLQNSLRSDLIGFRK